MSSVRTSSITDPSDSFQHDNCLKIVPTLYFLNNNNTNNNHPPPPSSSSLSTIECSTTTTPSLTNNLPNSKLSSPSIITTNISSSSSSINTTSTTNTEQQQLENTINTPTTTNNNTTNTTTTTNMLMPTMVLEKECTPTMNNTTTTTPPSNNNTTTTTSIPTSLIIKPQRLFIETKQQQQQQQHLIVDNSNIPYNDENSPSNSEFSSIVSDTSYGSSLPTTPNNSHQLPNLFNNCTASSSSLSHIANNDEFDWEIIVKNRNAQQLARMASSTNLVFKSNSNPSTTPSNQSNLNYHHSLTTPKLDTSSLNETSFKKNMIVRHCSDQRIKVSSSSPMSGNNNGEPIHSPSVRQRRMTSFLWGSRKTSTQSEEEEEEEKKKKNQSKNVKSLNISASSIESTSSAATNNSSNNEKSSEESFIDFLQSVECRMNVVSIESIESATRHGNTSSTKETLKKSKFWDKLKVIKKAIKKQLMEEEKPNQKHERKSLANTSSTTHQSTILADLDCKSTSSSSLTSISDEDKCSVIISKPISSTIRSAEDEMRHCLGDPICSQLFDEFCCQECSQENLLLWKELNKVKSNFKKLSDKRRSKTLRTIHSKFFSENSESFDVNVSGRTKVQIEEQVNSKRVSLVSGAHVLNSLQRDCINNLCDSFSRFILTEDYKLWKQNFDR